MNYDEAAEFLFGLRRFSMDPGTGAVEALLAELDRPEASFESIQVAGTNGKGSTARMLESVLRAGGASVGLYTSPHLQDLGERVRVDGRPIPDSAVAAFVERTKPWLDERAAAGEPLTFFEVVTAMALWWFDRAGVGIAVLEVGLGGEYDATSAVDPAAACVTNVAPEHTGVLGEDVAEIARTMAAVAPAGRPLVTAATGDALATVRDVAGEVSTVGRPEDDPDVRAVARGRISRQESAVSLAGEGWAVDARLPLLGDHQARNAGVAAALARQIAAPSPDTIADGLRSAHWPGRFEVIATGPLVVLDGAHNPAACGTVAGTLDGFEFGSLHLAFAAMHEKDHAGMVERLPRADSVVTCEPEIDRAADAEVLARAFERGGYPPEAVDAGGAVPAALAAARERAGPDDCVLLTGSLFAVAEARAEHTRTVTPRRVPDRAAAADLLEGAHVPEPARDRAASGFVHRTVSIRAQPRQARRLREELRAVGGTAAVSGAPGGELIDVVLAGTLDQFERFRERLADDPDGLGEIPELIARRVEGARGPAPPWGDGTAVMGVLNVTPDSFHDGGEYDDLEDAVDRAEAMVGAGADIVDVGGESTRPGADPVPVDEEIDRIVPVLEAVSSVDALVSVDTRKPRVAEAALDAGADVLNDVTGLEDPEMRSLVAERGVPVVVMHSVEAPVDPDTEVAYGDVVDDVIRHLNERLLLADKAGIPRENVIVDPGIGFGKTAAESFELLSRLDEFAALECPVLVGHSHKSLFSLIGAEPGDAPAETVAATALAAERGADIVRVHDVAENRAAVDVVEAARDPFDAG